MKLSPFDILWGISNLFLKKNKNVTFKVFKKEHRRLRKFTNSNLTDDEIKSSILKILREQMKGE